MSGGELTVDDCVKAVRSGLPRDIAERAALTLTQDERDELRARLDGIGGTR